MNTMLSNTISFTKIKVKPGTVELEFEETKRMKAGDEQEWIESSDYKVLRRLDPVKEFHDALQALKPHVVVILEMFDSLEELPEHFMSTITVTGISLGGSDEYAGVTIVAQRKLKSGKVFNMITPFTRFSDDENPDAYPHGFELASLVSAVEANAREYLAGKHAAGVQLELFPAEPQASDFDAMATNALAHDEIGQQDIRLEISTEGMDAVTTSLAELQGLEIDVPVTRMRPMV